MYHVSTQGVDERIINVHYYYWKENKNYLKDDGGDKKWSIHEEGGNILSALKSLF